MGQHADICLILEGTYPYVTGGVSGWTHELITEQSHLNFHLLAVVPSEAELELKYKLPHNVVGLTTVRLGDLSDGVEKSEAFAKRLHSRLAEPISHMTSQDIATLEQFKSMVQTLGEAGSNVGSSVLLNNEEAWKELVSLYEKDYSEQSFLDYFWSYRSITGGIYSILLAELPSADIYHALSTGYAGLMAARAKIETGKAAIVTEHGIYTNERRVEVASASWLEATASKALTIENPRRDLRDLWIDSINNFSHLCYEACDDIVTLFKGNQSHQVADGANPAKMRIIPNGVNLQRFEKVSRQSSQTPTIALIGRVVPIKDIKSYIRAVSLLKQMTPDIKAYIIGPTEENLEYYNECKTMVAMLNLGDNIEFTGQVDVEHYLDHIDILVLSSLSESQPLVMLEAGACGIPLVATDVGACREIIEGSEDEQPNIGHGGFVVPLASPAAITESVYQLLSDQALYAKSSSTIKQRIHHYYNAETHQNSYRDLYAQYIGR